MNFVSTDFAIFIAVILPLYFVLSHRGQNRMLLVASYVFYGFWDWRFLFLIFGSSLADHFLALRIANGANLRQKKLAVAVSVGINLGTLAIFKYTDFFISSLNELVQQLNMPTSFPLMNIVLPVGISFFTFQKLSYVLDVYRGKLRPTRNIDDFLLYVSFFPQLVAGPIERGERFMPQICKPRTVSLEQFYSGAQLAAVGFFKKMVLADNLAIIVNKAFASPTEVSGGSYLLAVYAFTFQIYLDFSSYTDIARGVARMLGFDLMENFRLPYFARNPGEFWQRWHISLSTWLKDYLYIPLGGNRKGRWRTYRNLSITMLLGGLWHGAAWHFVLWGGYHGFLLILFRLVPGLFKASAIKSRVGRSVMGSVQIFLFFHLTCLGWLIFRVENMEQLTTILHTIWTRTAWSDFSSNSVLQLAILVGPLMAVQAIQYLKKEMEPWTRWPIWVRVPMYLGIIYGAVLLGAPIVEAFIYFQF